MKHQPMLSGRVLGYRAHQVLAYIRLEIERTGFAPSYSMIADACEIAKGKPQVWDIVNSLERRGLVSRVGAGKVRRIRLNGA